jgi:predicted nucleotidyltransferase
MRTIRGADALFPKIRKQLLAALFLESGRAWYASELARHIRAPKQSLQRELRNLVAGGILRRRVEGKHVYYQTDPDCPFREDLRGLIIKTAGLIDILGAVLKPLRSRIAMAFVYGSFATGDEVSTSNVDLFVVGDVGLADLAPAARRATSQLGREVNPTVFAPDEFYRKASSGAGFVHVVLEKPKLFVIGSQDELEEARERAAGRPPARDPGRIGPASGHRPKKPR